MPTYLLHVLTKNVVSNQKITSPNSFREEKNVLNEWPLEKHGVEREMRLTHQKSTSWFQGKGLFGATVPWL